MKFDSNASRFLSLLKSIFRLPIIIGLFVLCLGGGYLYWHFNHSESAIISVLSEEEQAEYYRWKTEPIGVDASAIDAEPSTPEFQRDLENFLSTWREVNDHYNANETQIIQIISHKVEPNEEDAEMIAGFSDVFATFTTLVENEQYDLNRANLMTNRYVSIHFLILRNTARICAAASISAAKKGDFEESLFYTDLISNGAKTDPFATYVNGSISISMLSLQISALSNFELKHLSPSHSRNILSQLNKSMVILESVDYDFSQPHDDEISLIKNMIILGELSSFPSDFESKSARELWTYIYPAEEIEKDNEAAKHYVANVVDQTTTAEQFLGKTIDELIQLRDSITNQTTHQTTPSP